MEVQVELVPGLLRPPPPPPHLGHQEQTRHHQHPRSEIFNF